jgi:hypothetical protein
MSFFGWIFWGVVLGLIVFGFWLDIKHRSKAPEKSANQELHESANLKMNQHYHNSNGNDGPNL